MIYLPRSHAQRQVERADKEGRFLKRVRRHPPPHRTRASSRVVAQGNSMKFRCTMMHQLGRPSRLLLSFLHLRHDARDNPVRHSPRLLHACTSLGKSNPVIVSTAGHRYAVNRWKNKKSQKQRAVAKPGVLIDKRLERSIKVAPRLRVLAACCLGNCPRPSRQLRRLRPSLAVALLGVHGQAMRS